MLRIIESLTCLVSQSKEAVYRERKEDKENSYEIAERGYLWRKIGDWIYSVRRRALRWIGLLHLGLHRFDLLLRDKPSSNSRIPKMLYRREELRREGLKMIETKIVAQTRCLSIKSMSSRRPREMPWISMARAVDARDGWCTEKRFRPNKISRHVMDPRAPISSKWQASTVSLWQVAFFDILRVSRKQVKMI